MSQSPNGWVSSEKGRKKLGKRWAKTWSTDQLGSALCWEWGILKIVSVWPLAHFVLCLGLPRTDVKTCLQVISHIQLRTGMGLWQPLGEYCWCGMWSRGELEIHKSHRGPSNLALLGLTCQNRYSWWRLTKRLLTSPSQLALSERWGVGQRRNQVGFSGSFYSRKWALPAPTPCLHVIFQNRDL